MIISARRKGSGADRSPIAIELDRFDPGLCRIQPVGTTLAELTAALIQGDRIIERLIPAFKPGDNALQLFQGVLERHFFDCTSGFHGDAMGQAGNRGQEAARTQVQCRAFLGAAFLALGIIGRVIGNRIGHGICHAPVTPKAVTWAAKIDRGMPKAMAGGVIAG